MFGQGLPADLRFRLRHSGIRQGQGPGFVNGQGGDQPHQSGTLFGGLRRLGGGGFLGGGGRRSALRGRNVPLRAGARGTDGVYNDGGQGGQGHQAAQNGGSYLLRCVQQGVPIWHRRISFHPLGMYPL